VRGGTCSRRSLNFFIPSLRSGNNPHLLVGPPSGMDGPQHAKPIAPIAMRLECAASKSGASMDRIGAPTGAVNRNLGTRGLPGGVDKQGGDIGSGSIPV